MNLAWGDQRTNPLSLFFGRVRLPLSDAGLSACAYVDGCVRSLAVFSGRTGCLSVARPRPNGRWGSYACECGYVPKNGALRIAAQQHHSGAMGFSQAEPVSPMKTRDIPETSLGLALPEEG